MIVLVGGGRVERDPDGEEWRSFVTAAQARRRVPRVAVIVVRPIDAKPHAARIVGALRAVGRVDARITVVREGRRLRDTVFHGIDALVVCGGVTPVYNRVFAPHAERVRALVQDGVPFAGFSAGAAIAPAAALVGGWRRGGVPVLDPDAAEDLDELTVQEGLGLVPFAVDVHAAQWGTLARMITAVEQGLVTRGAAIDERTALVIDDDAMRVEGHGNVWWVEPGDEGVHVRREHA